MGHQLCFGKIGGWEKAGCAIDLAALFDLSENKLLSVTDMFAIGWGEGGKAWKWRKRLFAWEEEQVAEIILLLTNFVLH